MKFTNDQMFQNIMTMRGLHEKGVLGYAIARNMRRMTDSSKEFLDVRDQLLKKYGEDQGNGNFIIPPENAEDYAKELSQYTDIEHDVDVFQISDDDFMSGNLDNQQMYTLDWMLKSEAAP